MLTIVGASTAGSGLAVSYISANTNVATIRGNVLTIVGAGQVAITAIQAGDSVWNPAPVVQQILTINDPNKEDQSIEWNQTLAFDQDAAPVALTAEASSGLAVSYTSDNTNVAVIAGDTLRIVGPGMATITATQAGDSVWNPAPEVQQFVTVNDPNKEDQTIEWEQTLNDYLVGDSVLLFAKASSGLVVSYISANTNIAFIEGDMLHVVGSGQVIITAIQAGDSVWNPAKVEKTFLIVLDTAKRNQEILWNQTLAYTLGDLPIPLTAEATSGKKVRYTSGNTNVALVLHDSELGDLLVIVGPGMSTITATQEGDSIYNPAPVEKQLFTTTKGYWPFDSCVTTLECNFFMLNLRTLRANINANNEALGLDTVIILHARWYLDGEEEQHELLEGVAPARDFIAGSSYSAGRKAGDRMKDGTYHFVLHVREINAQDTGKFNELDLRSGDRIVEGCSEGATTTKLTVYPNPAAGNRSIFVRAALDASPRADNMVRVYNVVTGALVKEVPRMSDLTEITLSVAPGTYSVQTGGEQVKIVVRE